MSRALVAYTSSPSCALVLSPGGTTAAFGCWAVAFYAILITLVLVGCLIVVVPRFLRPTEYTVVQCSSGLLLAVPRR